MKKSVAAKLAFGLLALSYVGAGAYSYDAMGRRLNNAQSANAPKIWRVQPEQVGTTAAEQFGLAGLQKAPDANTLAVGQDFPYLTQKSKKLNATPVACRKDTKMLVTGWGRFAELRHWDESHVNNYNIDEEEIYRDWIAAVQELNWFFAAKEGLVNPNNDPNNSNVMHYLTQDEIKFKVFHVNGQSPVKDFPFWNEGGVGRDGSRIKKAIQFALGVNSTVYMNQSFSDFAASHNIQNVITNSLDAGYPVIIREGNHVMMIDAYAITTRNVKWVRLLNPENHGSFQWRVLNTVNIDMYVDYGKNVTVQYSDNDLRKDPDGDGMVTFDEVNRFNTDPARWDTDGDQYGDKVEVRTCTMLELTDLQQTGTNALGVDRLLSTGGGYVVGVKNELWADVNKNGVRAEKDRLERGFSAEGLLNGGHLPLYVENGIPGDFDIYAMGSVFVYAGVTCNNYTNAPSSIEKCSYASERKNTSTPVEITQANEVASVYAKGGVLVGNNTFVRRLEQFTSTQNDPGYYLNDGASVMMYYKGPEETWPWGFNFVNLESFTTGTNDKTVNANETYRLNPNSNVRALRVKSGGKLQIEPGEVRLHSLILEEGSEVRFIRSSQKTTIYVLADMSWKTRLAVANGNEYKNLAKNFKVVYHGLGSVALAHDWAGVMFAPKATLMLGHDNETIYGRFLGYHVAVWQNTIIKTYHGQTW